MSVKTEDIEKAAARTARRRKKDGILRFLRVMIAIMLVAVIALAAVLYLAMSGRIFRPGGTGGAEMPLWTPPPAEPMAYTVTCLLPQGEPLTVSGTEGETVKLPDSPEIPGYSFLGWTTGKGESVAQTEFVLDSNLCFIAVYAPALRDAKAETSHPAILSLDKDGLFRPEEPFSRADTVLALYSLLDGALTADDGAEISEAEAVESVEHAVNNSEESLEGAGGAAAKEAFEKAQALLIELGVLDGQLDSPDEPISFAELFKLLSAFFPKSEASYQFENIPESDPRCGDFALALEKGWIEDASVDPDRALTRRDAARILCRVAGRAGDAAQDHAKVGTILDLSSKDPDFWAIAEAVIPHESAFESDGEHWSSSEALPLRQEGLFFVGTALHCIDADGCPVISDSYGNFDFGSDGVITTGMPELDELVQQKLRDLAEANGIEDVSDARERMLRIAYNDITYHNSYLPARNSEIYEVGDTSFVNDAAYKILTTHKGCCYNYNSAFYVCAKALGYDAVIYSGKVNPVPIQRPHAWVEIEFDGIPYVFDPENEYTQVIKGHTGQVFFKLPYERVKGWYYYKGE